VGGYTDWLRQRPADQPVVATRASKPASKLDTAPAAAKRKLTFKEQRELDELPKRIEQLESEIANQMAAINEPAFFQQDSSTIVQTRKALVALQADLETIYARWAELDG
jgi:ATP-binding cassette subfamily F protein uup